MEKIQNNNNNQGGKLVQLPPIKLIEKDVSYLCGWVGARVAEMLFTRAAVLSSSGVITLDHVEAALRDLPEMVGRFVRDLLNAKRRKAS